MPSVQRRRDFLPVYERCGLVSLKLGEDAIVDLGTFHALGQREEEGLREAIHKLERQGFAVRHYHPPLDQALLAGLKGVSDDWLQIRGRRERQFTLGRFDAERC